MKEINENYGSMKTLTTIKNILFVITVIFVVFYIYQTVETCKRIQTHILSNEEKIYKLETTIGIMRSQIAIWKHNQTNAWKRNQYESAPPIKQQRNEFGDIEHRSLNKTGENE